MKVIKIETQKFRLTRKLASGARMVVASELNREDAKRLQIFLRRFNTRIERMAR